MGAEFLAMILVVVYVGAVAVLFLFVVMMLDIDFAELRAGLPAATCRSARVIGLILLVELVLVFGAWIVGAAGGELRLGADRRAAAASPTPMRSGRILYTTTSISSRPPAWSCWWP